jgi:hypothetical protein
MQYVAFMSKIPFFKKYFIKYSINVDTYICMSTHPYKHTYAHHTLISISERLSRFDLEIHEVSHQERLTVDSDIVSH